MTRSKKAAGTAAVNEAFQLWVLHVWLYRDNPSGIFSDWNPTVSCAAAR